MPGSSRFGEYPLQFFSVRVLPANHLLRPCLAPFGCLRIRVEKHSGRAGMIGYPYRSVMRSVALNPNDHVVRYNQTARTAHGGTLAHWLKPPVEIQTSDGFVNNIPREHPHRIGILRPLECKDGHPRDGLRLAALALAAPAEQQLRAIGPLRVEPGNSLSVRGSSWAGEARRSLYLGRLVRCGSLVGVHSLRFRIRRGPDLPPVLAELVPELRAVGGQIERPGNWQAPVTRRPIARSIPAGNTTK